MHEYGGFFLNLPFAYMSRQFPRPFSTPLRSTGGGLLAMHKIMDPARCAKGFRRLEHLVNLARRKPKVKGTAEQAAWRRKHDVSAKTGWILRSEQRVTPEAHGRGDTSIDH